MSQFLIGYSPNIPEIATVTSSASFDDWKPANNLTYGSKSQYAELDTASASTRWVKYFYSSPKSVNFAYLGRADLLIDQGIDNFILSKSPDDVTYGTVANEDVSSEKLIGVRRDDLVYTFNDTEADNYYWLQYSGTSSKLRHSKAFIGTWFDFDCQPTEFDIKALTPLDEFETDSGAGHFQVVSLPRNEYRIVWEGISDIKATAFTRIVDSRFNGFLLYTTGNNQVLDSDRSVYTELISYRKEITEGTPDWNKITCTFREWL